MFIGFEGTGMSMKSNGAGVNDLSHTTSLVWKAYEQATSPYKRYEPGPNVQGDNCGFILEEAIRFYERDGQFDPDHRIVLFGYSRGAYVAMCFAKYLQKKFDRNVFYLGMFDAVSKDFKFSVPKEYRTTLVPTNVTYCFHAARSKLVGSRKTTMNHAGDKYEGDNKAVTYKLCPGSHAAMGGFPNEAGIGDGPNFGYGDPNDGLGKRFDPRREKTAVYHSAKHVSVKAAALGLLRSTLMPVNIKPAELIPEDKWDWDNRRLYGYSRSTIIK